MHSNDLEIKAILWNVKNLMQNFSPIRFNTRVPNKG